MCLIFSCFVFNHNYDFKNLARWVMLPDTDIYIIMELIDKLDCQGATSTRTSTSQNMHGKGFSINWNESLSFS